MRLLCILMFCLHGTVYTRVRDEIFQLQTRTVNMQLYEKNGSAITQLGRRVLKIEPIIFCNEIFERFFFFFIRYV